jgi:hypothetical protein
MPEIRKTGCGSGGPCSIRSGCTIQFKGLGVVFHASGPASRSLPLHGRLAASKAAVILPVEQLGIFWDRR